MARILIVDDQEFVRSALAVVLRAKGYDVVEASGASSALTAFEDHQFELAIIDIYMPNVDGVNLIKALRKASPDLPIIAMSGVLLNNSERTALEFLPNLPNFPKVLYLKKPFRHAELLTVVQTALSSPTQVVPTCQTS